MLETLLFSLAWLWRLDLLKNLIPAQRTITPNARLENLEPFDSKVRAQPTVHPFMCGAICHNNIKCLTD